MKEYIKPIILVGRIDVDSDLLGTSIVMDIDPDNSAHEPACGKQNSEQSGWDQPNVNLWQED